MTNASALGVQKKRATGAEIPPTSLVPNTFSEVLPTTHFCIAICTAVLTADLLSAPASAQGYPWLDTLPVAHFTDEDWSMLRGTTRELVDNGADGKEDSWKNSASGSDGSVKVLNTYEHNELRCRRAYSSNSAGRFNGSGVYSLCKVADGSWKIAP